MNRPAMLVVGSIGATSNMVLVTLRISYRIVSG